ncbi:hydantoinase/oxoprolinase family protein [Castellaniella sp.]|uniref:hydantoinase/oxoprolinase family protein n=1 Tax=Castellaniella sp. TaxID=1955812 RepID=UPI003C70CD59
MISISADVGGTFTDIILADGRRNTVYADKVLSTPGSSQAIIEGIQLVAGQAGIRPSEIDVFVHGFTIATNAWLTRSGARVVLAVTQGFRDVLEIGTQRRPLSYSLKHPATAPLAPRSQVVEVAERMDAFGRIVTDFSDQDAAAVAERICAMEPEAVAISFLFSYLNPVHEDRLAAAILARRPDLTIYKSADINPQAQEYPRTNTTVTSAYVGPIVDRYLTALQAALPGIGMTAPLLLMRSDGGVATAQTACRQPVNMLLSGPAGGVVAALSISERHQIPNLITFDMGGTSADFSLIADGQAATATERSMGGEILRMTSLDISTISAGGGSIGSVDLGGAIRVGPESAGSNPGPACYGRGGTRPTLSDAALIMGLLDKDVRLANGLTLDLDRAVAAMQADIGDTLNIRAEEAAFGMVAIANAQMAQAIRSLSVEKGFDVRAFSLLSFGGAGSLFAPFLMDELDMREIVIPARPGVFSASGLLLSDIKYHFQSPFPRALDELSAQDIGHVLSELRVRADAAFERDGIEPARRAYRFAADMRYIGQVHELVVPMADGSDTDEAQTWQRDDMLTRFVRLHEQTYGFSDLSMPCEVVNLRLEAIGTISRPDTEESSPPATPGKPSSRRTLYLGPDWGHVDADIYERRRLGANQRIQGPAVITQADTTILLLPDQTARVDNGLLRVSKHSLQD